MKFSVRSARQVVARFGRRLRAIRREAGVTQEQLAARSGASRRSIVRLEQGEMNPSLVTAALLSAALDRDLVDLLQ